MTEKFTMRSTRRDTYGTTIDTITFDPFDSARQPSPGHFWDRNLKMWRNETEAGQAPPSMPRPRDRRCAYCLTAPGSSTNCINCGAPQS